MIGRRIENPNNYTNTPTVQPGDYWKDRDGHWYVAAPVSPDDDGFLLIADVSTWTVIEHEDRTITVQPSIFWGMGGYPNSPPEWAAKHTWHGWLKHGEWSEA